MAYTYVASHLCTASEQPAAHAGYWRSGLACSDPIIRRSSLQDDKRYLVDFRPITMSGQLLRSSR